MLATMQDWSAAGYGLPWPETVGLAVAALALALFAIFLVKCVVRRGRYRAVDTISEADRAALAARVGEAEKSTTGEIVVVVVERSDRHPAAPWIAALVTLLVGSAALAGFLPWGSPLVLLVQAALAGVGFLCAHFLADFRRTFVRESRASEVCDEQAVQEFHHQGVGETEERTGVLLFVSLFERRVVVLADKGIDARVDAERWVRTDEAILSGIKRGDLVGGLREGVDMCGAVLAENFPMKDGDRDELPNHVIVRRE